MTRKWRVSAGLVLLGMIGGVQPASPYEVVDISNGGALQGVVTMVGVVPAPKAYNLITYPDPEYCGRISNGHGWRLLRDFLVNDQGAVQNVVVFLEDVSSGKPFALSIPRIEAKDCQFLPFTTVVRSGHGVEVINMDPVMHDIQAYETSHSQGARVLFNSPLPFNHRHQRDNLHATHDHQPGRSLVQQFTFNKGRKTFVMQCGFHAYMESWAVVVENPYFSFTDENGKFHIDRVPPGTYELRAWHPSVKHEIRKRVTVSPGETVSVNFELPAPQGRRTAHTVMSPPRFGPGALGRPVSIDPFVERQ